MVSLVPGFDSFQLSLSNGHVNYSIPQGILGGRTVRVIRSEGLSSTDRRVTELATRVFGRVSEVNRFARTHEEQGTPSVTPPAGEKPVTAEQKITQPAGGKPVTAE